LKVEENHIIVEKSARFYLNNPSSKEIKSFWFVLHGYAQLASDFIKELDFLDNDNTLIVAPEGLSKFHTKNKIGASWMTREDRQNEIGDYLNYLNKILTQLSNNYNLSSAKVHLLGFSQGVHTAVRLFINTNFYFNNLILCSSDFPKDADFVKLKEKLRNSKLFYHTGKEDKIVSLVNFENNKKLLEDNAVEFEEIVFNGHHEIDKDFLNLEFGIADLESGD